MTKMVDKQRAVKKRKPSGFVFSDMQTELEVDPRAETLQVGEMSLDAREYIGRTGAVLDPDKFRTVAPEGLLGVGDLVVFRMRHNTNQLQGNRGRSGIVRKWANGDKTPWGVVIDFKTSEAGDRLAVVQLFVK